MPIHKQLRMRVAAKSEDTAADVAVNDLQQQQPEETSVVSDDCSGPASRKPAYQIDTKVNKVRLVACACVVYCTWGPASGRSLECSCRGMRLLQASCESLTSLTLSNMIT
jgi:hypothetical protein